MEKQMFVLGDLMEKEWDTGRHIVALTDRLAKGEEKRSQMIGWDPETEVAPSSRQRKKKKRKLVVGQGSWRTELKPRTPGKRRTRERRKILHRNPSK